MKPSDEKEEKFMYLPPQNQPGFRPAMFDSSIDSHAKRSNPLITAIKAAPVSFGCLVMTVASFIGASKNMGKDSHRFHMWLNMRIFFQFCTVGSLLLTVHLRQKRKENEAAREELDSLMALKES